VIRERKREEATEDWARQVRDRAYVEFREEATVSRGGDRGRT
jgi:peptidyl-prolyl cis-trans isomerase SurA